MTPQRPADVLISGTKTALLHFGKAAFEIASGVGVLAVSVARSVRPEPEGSLHDADRPQKIEIE